MYNTLYCFDFDDTLIHTMLPDPGMQIWQEKTDPLVHKILREVNDFLPISQYRLERFALSFVLSQNTGAIVGIRSLDQLTRAISSYAQPYSHTIMFKILEKIDSELRNLKVGLGDPGLGG